MNHSSISPSGPAATASTPLSPLSAILRSSISYLVLTTALCLFALAPLFYPGYIQTHSGFIPIWNIIDLRANLGYWRWLPHVATQFDPLRSGDLWPYYLASLLPFEPALAIKVVLGLGWLLGSLGMFLWLNKWLGSAGALVAALVYTYLPHQIATVYVRGAWAETFCLGLLPWAMLVSEWASQQSTSQEKRDPASPIILLISGALIWLLLGLSHLGLGIWAFALVSLFLLALYSWQSLWPIVANLGGLILAVAITFTIVTASPLASSASTTPPASFSDHFLYPFQLFSAYWGFGPSRPGWNDGLSFQLGLAAVGLTLLTLFLWQRRPGEPAIERTDRRLLFFSSAAIVLILLQFGFTQLFWNLPLLPGYTWASTLTYPWQLLGLVGLCLAVLAGASIRLDGQLACLPLFSSIIILIILSSYNYLLPQFIQIEPEMMSGPQAILGSNQVALLAHSFVVEINGNTAGLERAQAAIPLTAYGSPQAGQKMQLDITWQALQPFTQDWKVFVHLADANGQVVAQFDGQPREGLYPTSRWIPGELVKDSYPLVIPTPAPPGPYRVFVGLYDEATGARLPVPGDSEGRVILNVE